MSDLTKNSAYALLTHYILCTGPIWAYLIVRLGYLWYNTIVRFNYILYNYIREEDHFPQPMLLIIPSEADHLIVNRKFYRLSFLLQPLQESLESANIALKDALWLYPFCRKQLNLRNLKMKKMTLSLPRRKKMGVTIVQRTMYVWLLASLGVLRWFLCFKYKFNRSGKRTECVNRHAKSTAGNMIFEYWGLLLKTLVTSTGLDMQVFPNSFPIDWW